MEIIIAVALVIGTGLFFSIRKFMSVPTYQQYKAAHPDLVKPGAVTCAECGGNQIYVMRAGHAGATRLAFHVCRHCGAKLYRSAA
ncbi:MAG TPA: hypothetical protein VGF45_04620 [Polyangia bacterium]